MSILIVLIIIDFRMSASLSGHRLLTTKHIVVLKVLFLSLTIRLRSLTFQYFDLNTSHTGKWYMKMPELEGSLIELKLKFFFLFLSFAYILINSS